MLLHQQNLQSSLRIDCARAGPVLGEIVGDSWSVLCPHTRQFFEKKSANQNEAKLSTEIGFR
jgi:hypothetical protein